MFNLNVNFALSLLTSTKDMSPFSDGMVMKELTCYAVRARELNSYNLSHRREIDIKSNFRDQLAQQEIVLPLNKEKNTETQIII